MASEEKKGNSLGRYWVIKRDGYEISSMEEQRSLAKTHQISIKYQNISILHNNNETYNGKVTIPK